MPSNVFDSILLHHLWGTDEMRAIFSDETRVQKWLDLEAALALEQAALGIVPEAAARDIAEHARVALIDLEVVAEGIRKTKHPLVPALREVQKRCQPQHGEWIHFGPTTQDVLDTGVALQLKAAHAIILRDLGLIGRELYRLADAHKHTAMVGRTHVVHALPITFGHKCAIWLRELARHHERLVQAEPRVFVGGLVGAVGTQASFGERAATLEARVMARLGLGCADISWQPARDRLGEYVVLVGLLGATLAKIANEVLNLSRNEVGELEEPFNEGKVGSSTMPHKRNPTVVENIVTVGRALRHAVALMTESMHHEHERDGAAWKMEWKALPESCLMISAMLAQTKFVLSGLVVHADRMRRNLDLLGGYILSERVMFALSDKLGKQTAHEVVYEASMHGQTHGLTLEAALRADPRVGDALDGAALARVLDPTTYVGGAPAIVERALAKTLEEGWLA
ncbi:MAG TPA: adenylosuccinate lyase [Candidatus Sulfotelmatobacter sp.]|nr:adenylosuccinate lyase [Candidatus Sulfotelmatobacter sp.]